MFSVIFLILLLNKVEINGFELAVTSRRFPYQVSLRFFYNDDHHCSGTIIGKKFLLTAGHCVCSYIKYYMLYAVVGADSFIDEGTKYNIENSICHEDFNYKHLRNDLALIKLKNKLEFTESVQPLPLANFKLKKRSLLIMAVWGFKNQYVIPPVHFQVQFTLLVDNKKCVEMFGKHMVDDTNICTMSSQLGACVGDSGGPVVYRGHLVGIISFGKECIAGYPNVHTNISSYANWIQDVVILDSLLND